MSDIPADAFREILQRVPVDSLFTMRSVCKSWREIIDGSQFTKIHIHRGIGDGWILYRNKTGKIFLTPLNHLIYHNLSFDCKCDKTRKESCSKCSKSITAKHIKAPAGRGIPRVGNLPVPCCNGLVLISSIVKCFGWVIWNPFTGESLQLPLCDEFPNDGFTAPYSGIGYDEANDDYKVVRIADSHTFICSVNSKTWHRACDFPSDCRIAPLMYNGVFVNGALYWVAYTVGIIGVRGWIVALNLTTEVYQKISVPLEVGIVQNHNALKLVELSGCLFLTSCNRVGWFLVWMMNDYNGSDNIIWTRVMCLNMDEHFIEDLSLIAYKKDEKIILLRYKSEMSLWYDMEKVQFRQFSMEVNPDAKGNYHDYQSLRCIYAPSSQVIPASLVRLRGNDGANERATSEAKSLNRKRKRAQHHETLELKISFKSPGGGGA